MSLLFSSPAHYTVSFLSEAKPPVFRAVCSVCFFYYTANIQYTANAGSILLPEHMPLFFSCSGYLIRIDILPGLLIIKRNMLHYYS